MAAIVGRAAVSPLRQVSARLSPRNRSLDDIVVAAEDASGEPVVSVS